jgi:Ran GTPase-activating protein (RanGAP) involved in mRNA processing and transport
MKNLVNFVNLTTFNFSYILDIDDDHTIVLDTLAGSLPKMPSLRTLNLSGNFISIESLKNLLKSIIKSQIESLNLSDTHIDSDIISKSIPVILKPNPQKGYEPKIKELIIKNNKIDDACADALAIALRVNTTLIKLDISDNKISDAKKEALKKEFGDRLIL